MTALQTTETLMAGQKAVFETLSGETASQPIFAEVYEADCQEEIETQLIDAACRFAEGKGWNFLGLQGAITFNKPF